MMASKVGQVELDLFANKCANCKAFNWEQVDPTISPLKRCTRSPTAARSARRSTGTRCTGGTASTSLARNLWRSPICIRRKLVAAASSRRLLEGKSSKRTIQPMFAPLTPSSIPTSGQRSIRFSKTFTLCPREKAHQADLKGFLMCLGL